MISNNLDPALPYFIIDSTFDRSCPCPNSLDTAKSISVYFMNFYSFPRHAPFHFRQISNAL